METEEIRIWALALVAVASAACSGAPPAGGDLPAQPTHASSPSSSNGGDGTGQGDQSDTLTPTDDTSSSDDDAGSTTTSTEPESASDAGPPPSTSPLCGTSLTCSTTSIQGASACRQQQTSTTDIYCCPNPGDRIENGACAAPPLCGTGLSCSGSMIAGGSSCRQQTTSTTAIWCCPKGQTVVNGKCQ